MPRSHLDDHLVAVPPAHGLDPGVVDHLADLLAVGDRLELDMRLLRVGRLDLDRARRQLQVQPHRPGCLEGLAAH